MKCKIISRVKETAEKYYQPVIEKVENANAEGKRIATGYRQAINRWNTLMSFGVRQITPIAKELRFKPSGTRFSSLKNLETVDVNANGAGYTRFYQYVHGLTTPPPLSPIEQRTISAYDQTHAFLNAELSRLGGTGTIGYVPALTAEVREGIYAKSGALYDKLVDVLEKENAGYFTREQIETMLENNEQKEFDRFPTHIDVDGELVPVVAADPLSAIEGMNRELSRTAALAKTFGIDSNDNLKKLKEAYRKAGGSVDDFDRLQRSFYGVGPKRDVDPRSFGRKWGLGLFNPAVQTAALSLSGPVQLMQFLPAYTNVGFLPFVKGMAKWVRSPQRTSAELAAIGTIPFDVLNLPFRKGQKVEDLGRAIREVGGRATGFTPINQFLDRVSASMYREFARGLIAKGGKLSLGERMTLEQLKLSPAQIDMIEKGKMVEPAADLTRPQTNAEEIFTTIINNGRKSDQSSGKEGTEKSRFQLNPLAQVAVPFQGFVINQVNRIKNEIANIYEAGRSGDMKKLGAAAQRLGTFALFSAAAGEFAIAMRHLLKGRDPDDEREDENVVQRFFNDLAEVSLLGPFQRMYESWGYANSGERFLVGLSMPGNIAADFLNMLMRQGVYADKTASERALTFLERRAPITALPDGIKQFTAAMGLSEFPAIEMDNAVRAYYSFRRDEGLDTGSLSFSKSGFDEARRAYRLLYDAIKDGKGDDEIDQLLADALKIKTDIAKDADKAKKSLQASLRTRKLLADLKPEQLAKFEKSVDPKKFELLQSHDRLLDHYINTIKPVKSRKKKSAVPAPVE